jgi:hypothetical protein
MHTNALRCGKFPGDNPLKPIANRQERDLGGGAESPGRGQRAGLNAGDAEGGKA